MKPNSAAKLTTAMLTVLFLSSAIALPGAAPEVRRVEPPNWWPGHSHNPVRLLISGAHFEGAYLIAPPGFTSDNVRVSENGTFLMVDLHVPPQARPGPVGLTVATPHGRTAVPWTLAPVLPRNRRFAGFSPDDVIYLLMPDRFVNGDRRNDDPEVSRGLLDRSKPRHYHGGDLQGVRSRLAYLRDLGVTAIWPTPWYDNVNHLNHLEKYTADNRRDPSGDPVTDYHGYGAVDFYGVEERFGNLAQLRALADAAHRAGLKIIQDQVANHTGPYHAWTTNAPTPTWYNGTVDQHLENTWQTWTLTATNPPPDKLRSTLEGWFINILPDLNQNDPETAAYLIQNSLWWVGMTGLDAVRQDTLPYVPRPYWARWARALKREYPRLTILGEMWDGDPKQVAFFQGGQRQFDGVDSEIDTLFDFPLHYAIRDAFAKGQSMKRLSQTLASDRLYVNPRVLVTFLGLHDTPRFLSEPGATLAGLKHAFTFLATTRGTPLVYYGDEIALRGGGDPDNRRDFPGGWREDAQNAFTRAGRSAEQEEVHAHVRKVLRLRRQLEPLRRGNLVELTVTDHAYAFARCLGNQCVIVAFNNSPQAQRLSLSLPPIALPVPSLTDRLGALGRIPVREGSLELSLPASTAVILVP
jgi:glycosidase